MKLHITSRLSFLLEHICQTQQGLPASNKNFFFPLKLNTLCFLRHTDKLLSSPHLGSLKEFQKHLITKEMIQYRRTDHRRRLSQERYVIRIEIVSSDRPSVHISQAKNKNRIMGRDSTIRRCRSFVPEVQKTT